MSNETEAMSQQLKDTLQLEAADRDKQKLKLEKWKTVCSAFSLLSIVVGLGAWHSVDTRAKADRAIVLLQDLAKTMTPATRAAQKLQMEFRPKDLAKLTEGEPFEIDKKDKPLLDAALGSETALTRGWSWKNIASEKYTLTARESFTLRWQIASYLNAIEVVCQAKKSNVADSAIIVEELRGLYTAESGCFCKNYRNFIDEKTDASRNRITSERHAPCYPAINMIVEEFEKY